MRPGNVPLDPRADPRYWDYTWTNWCDSVPGGCPAPPLSPAPGMWDPQLQQTVLSTFRATGIL